MIRVTLETDGLPAAETAKAGGEIYYPNRMTEALWHELCGLRLWKRELVEAGASFKHSDRCPSDGKGSCRCGWVRVLKVLGAGPFSPDRWKGPLLHDKLTGAGQ